MAAAPACIGRLTRRPQFLHVAQGRKAHGRCVLLQMRERSDGPSASTDHSPLPSGPASVRYGLTASKRVGNAVVRNRARRRLRAAMLELLPGLGRAGCDYVAVARTAVVEAAWRDLLDELARLFQRLHQPDRDPRAGKAQDAADNPQGSR